MWENKKPNSRGFTIVELLIVVVVIAILAAITIVAYNGIRDRAQDSAAKSSVEQAYKKLEVYKTTNSAYPAQLSDTGIIAGSGTTFGYTRLNNNTEACVSATVGTKVYSMQNGSAMVQGDCGQVITSYYAAGSFTNPLLVRSESDADNDWGSGSPDPLVPSDNFWTRYEARITPPVTGDYTFYTRTDDVSELVVNGQTIIPTTAAGVREAVGNTTMSLTAGVPVTVRYSAQEVGGLAYATLSWSYPGQARVTIPASAFLRP